jgi:hypothetical protein
MAMESKPLHAATFLYGLFFNSVARTGPPKVAVNLAKLGSSAARRKLAR